MSIGQHLREDFQRGAETMHCTRPAAKAVSNGIEVRLGVQRQVGTDGLVSDVEFGAVWGHPTSVPATCWGPILPGQQGGNLAPEDAPGATGSRTCAMASPRRGLLRCAGGIGSRLSRIAAQFAQDGRGRAPQCSGHGPNTAALLHQTGYRHALFGLKLSVRRSCYSRHLTGWQGVAVQIRGRLPSTIVRNT